MNSFLTSWGIDPSVEVPGGLQSSSNKPSNKGTHTDIGKQDVSPARKVCNACFSSLVRRKT